MITTTNYLLASVFGPWSIVIIVCLCIIVYSVEFLAKKVDQFLKGEKDE